MITLSVYFRTWMLKLSHTKTMTAAFHLNNPKVKRELKVYNNRILPFCLTPTYLGGKSGRIAYVPSPSSGIAQKTIFARHTAEATCMFKIGCCAITLRTVVLHLVYSTAEYCAPVWCRSAHTRLTDSVLNDALRIVTVCLRHIPTDHSDILSGIQPAELRRKGATYRGFLDPDHTMHGLLRGPPMLAKRD